ncbi:hypothetical protein TNCV_2529931 [Trichonephila clavipes]|nr:hypothetical protein TNCV_2529931 [Trichonephila clavipes]
MDHVILNHGQETWMTPELEPRLLNTTPHQWKKVRSLDIFNVHHSITRPVLSSTELKLVTNHEPMPLPLGYCGHELG